MGVSSQGIDGGPAGRGMRFAWGALVVLFVVMYVVPLGVRPLGSPDEVRYGTVAREMLASGDWVSPRLNGARYFEKPAPGHWLNAVSLATFGENPFALRLPSALATGLTALIVFALTRRFVSVAAATLAAAIFLTTLAVGGVGTFAVLDPLLSLFTTAAVATWFLALQERKRSRRVGYLVACGVACGGAFLVKGFVGWAVPALVALGYIVAERRWRVLLALPWIPVGVAILVAAPWAVLIHLREPDFWRYFIWVEHINRFTSDTAQHARPPWFYLAFLPLVASPWIVTWPAAWIGLRRTLRGRPFLLYTALWALLPFVFFSISRGKLLTYILPCFPALAILLAAGVSEYFASARQRAMDVAMLVLAVVFSFIFAVLLVAQAGGFATPIYGPSESQKTVVLYVLLAFTALCCVVAYRNRRPFARVGAVALAGVAVVLPLEVLLPQRVVDRAFPSVAVAEQAPLRDTLVISDASLFGTVAWALGRDDIYVVSPGEIGYGLSYPDQRFRSLDGPMLEDLIAAKRSDSDILIVVKDRSEQQIAARLPADTRRVQQGSTVFLQVPKTE